MSSLEKDKQLNNNEAFFIKAMITGISIVGFISYTLILIVTTALVTQRNIETNRLKTAKNHGYLEEINELMIEVAELYDRAYVNDIETDNVNLYVLNSLIAAYGDKYAVYLDKEDADTASMELDGRLYGIGVHAYSNYNSDEDRYEPYISNVYEGSPAYKAGIQVGDIILKIDGDYLYYEDATFDGHISRLRGEKGEDVIVTIQREDETIDFKITRDEFTINTVRYDVIDNIGYIKIEEFTSNTDENFKIAFENIEKQEINKFIFDVRNNRGGLKDSVVNILDYLLPKGVIINELNHDGNVIDTDFSDEKYKEFESVTLINSETASAAELFTQSLIDYNKTETIGTNSFGKGTICSTYPLSNGGSLMLSTGKYLTISGIDLESIGIKPDYELELPDEKNDIYYKLSIHDDDLVLKAVDILSK